MAKRKPEQVRKNMQAIKGEGTKIEMLLAKSLWERGYRYRKNDRRFLGKPDLTFSRLKIAIFCDSEFWHGKDWDKLKQRLTTNPKYWVTKIEKNIARDKFVTQSLEKDGWTVLRFWENEILNNLKTCIATIEEAILNKTKG